jgi:hypothetical protein
MAIAQRYILEQGSTEAGRKLTSHIIARNSIARRLKDTMGYTSPCSVGEPRSPTATGFEFEATPVLREKCGDDSIVNMSK